MDSKLIDEALAVIAAANADGIYSGYVDLLLDNMPQLRDSQHAREIVAHLNVAGN